MKVQEILDFIEEMKTEPERLHAKVFCENLEQTWDPNQAEEVADMALLEYSKPIPIHDWEKDVNWDNFPGL